MLAIEEGITLKNITDERNKEKVIRKAHYHEMDFIKSEIERTRKLIKKAKIDNEIDVNNELRESKYIAKKANNKIS